MSSNLSGERIQLFVRDLAPNDASIFEGAVVVYDNTAGDNLGIVLPNHANALLAGKAYAGISMEAGTPTLASDKSWAVQKGGIAKCSLKASTACTRGGEAAYDPADGGRVVPFTSKKQVLIGRFTQTKSSSASPQMVGVELYAASNSLASGLMGMIVAPSTVLVGTTIGANTETAFDQTVTIPANTLAAGKKLRIKASGTCTAFTAANARIRLRLNGLAGLVLIDTTAVTPAANDVFVFEADCDCRSTTAMMVYGNQVFDAIGSNVTGVAYTLAQTYDATVANVVTVTGLLTVADATALRLDALSVELVG